MRDRFNKELRQLESNLMLMGENAKDCITLAGGLLLAGDIEMARACELKEESNDKMRHEIQSLSSLIMLKEQPVASDLQLVFAANSISHNLERIADQASDIASLLKAVVPIRIAEESPLNCMAKAVEDMLQKAMLSFGNRDGQLAQSIIALDDNVDDLFFKVKGECRSQKVLDLDKASLDILDALLIAKYFEKIGDNCVNIAQATLKIIGALPPSSIQQV